MPSRLLINALLDIDIFRPRAVFLRHAMDLASGREFIFVICIILLLLCARDLRKKYDCSQCIFHFFRSFVVYFLISG